MRYQKGQSTVEFIVSFTFSLALLFLFVQLAFNQVVGYLVHYATFVSSRTYLVLDSNSNERTNVLNQAEVDSKSIFNDYYKLRNQFPYAFKGPMTELQINKAIEAGDPTEMKRSILTGAYFEFQQKLSMMDLLGGNREVFLVSESFLGKEPSRIECHANICSTIKAKLGAYIKGDPCANSGTAENNILITLYDDGC